MPLPDLEDFCISLDELGPLTIQFPGGAELLAIVSDAGMTLLDQAQQMFNALNVALSPLKPLLDVVDVVIQVVECVKALPKAILGQPNDLLNCIENLTGLVSKLLALNPVTSFINLAKTVVDTMITFVQGLKSRIQALLRQAGRIIAAELKAAEPGNFQLASIIICIKTGFEAYVHNLNGSLGVINRIIGMINYFCKIAELPCLPSFDTLPDDLAAFADILDPLIDALNAIKELFGFLEFPGFALGPVDKHCDPI